MKTLVVGASGATGKLLVNELLDGNESVKVIVRSADKLPGHWKSDEQIEIIEATLLDLSDEELAAHVRDCDAIASCLGHNLTWKGIFGKPRKLVTDAVKRLTRLAAKAKGPRPMKFVLMNTAGNRNRDLNEPISIGERLIIALLRALLPPHPDNEQAADFLRTKIEQDNPEVEWVVVRPDTLIDEENASEYDVQPSPTRSALFNPGKTSRINVGHFMASLITQDDLWQRWKGQMPVIYNEMDK